MRGVRAQKDGGCALGSWGAGEGQPPVAAPAPPTHAHNTHARTQHAHMQHALQDALGVDAFTSSDEAFAAEALLEAYRSGDPDAVASVVKAKACFASMDNQVGPWCGVGGAAPVGGRGCAAWGAAVQALVTPPRPLRSLRTPAPSTLKHPHTLARSWHGWPRSCQQRGLTWGAWLRRWAPPARRWAWLRRQTAERRTSPDGAEAAAAAAAVAAAAAAASDSRARLVLPPSQRPRQHALQRAPAPHAVAPFFPIGFGASPPPFSA